MALSHAFSGHIVIGQGLTTTFTSTNPVLSIIPFILQAITVSRPVNRLVSTTNDHHWLKGDSDGSTMLSESRVERSGPAVANIPLKSWNSA
jgi:hypothetical protein